MKLYDFAQAPNPRKVRVYLAEKGMQVPLQTADLGKGEQRSPEFLKINPLGAVPVLELNDELKNREWVAGDKISVADITLLIGVGWAKVAKYELDPAWTNLIRWYDTMKARPSAKA